MRRTHLSVLSSIGLAVVLATVGCGGGSSAVTGADDVPLAGNAVIQGTVVGSGFAAVPAGELSASSGDGGMTVRVEGTPLASGIDEEGEFILAGVPVGSVTLVFEGSGAGARLTVSGLVDGQVLSLEVQVSGADAYCTTPPRTTPSKYTKITGTLEEMSGTRLRVSGHPVDASQVSKVWRGNRRIELEHLVVGEKLKVWGTLGGDGVLVAEEIKALTSGASQWVAFEGTITKVGASSRDIHANPNGGSGSCAGFASSGVHANPNGGSCPTFYVGKRKVVTDGSTKFRKKGGGNFDPQSIHAGQKAYVEGWRRPDGRTLAQKVVIG